MSSSAETGLRPYLTIRPAARWAPIDAAELWRFRDLLYSLAVRDVKLRYRQTALGAIWVVLQPLLAAGIFSFVFGKVAKLPTDGVPYFIFSYAGLLGWTAFQNTLSKSSTSLLQNAQLISKIFFPRLLLPLSTLISTLIDSLIALAVFGVLLVSHQIALTPAALLFPVWFVLILLLAIGAGVHAAALTVSYRDVQYVLPVVIQFLMYATPVAYSASAVPEKLRPFYFLNPLSGLLDALRWSLLGTAAPDWRYVAYSAVVSVAVFVVGCLSFKAMEQRFADVI